MLSSNYLELLTFRGIRKHNSFCPADTSCPQDMTCVLLSSTLPVPDGYYIVSPLQNFPLCNNILHPPSVVNSTNEMYIPP